MDNNLNFVGIFFIFLLILNYILIKFDFCIDRTLKKNSHKLLLKLNHPVPLSGTIYFVLITFLTFLNFDIYFFSIFICFFIIGLLSDLNITNSPKLRLFMQFMILLFFLYYNKSIIIDTRIEFLNNLMINEFFRIFIISFFFLVLINGFNFIDGVNNLCSLNFLIILFFSYLLINSINILYFEDSILILILSLSVFVILNFFGKNFLGDGAVYGLSFIIGYILINISLSSKTISPYFIANLLWYPAFENLFTIIRRMKSNKKNYLPDNEHLHQIIFKYLKYKFKLKKKFLISSITGIIINLYLFLSYFLGFIYYSKTNIQVILILFGIIIYIFTYFQLEKKLNE